MDGVHKYNLHNISRFAINFYIFNFLDTDYINFM